MQSAEEVSQEASVLTGLTWLLSPFLQEDFAIQYYAKKPLRIARADSAFYARLFPETEMEMALYAASQSRGAVELLSEDDTPQYCRFHEQAIDGFRQGKSLRIDSVQRFSHNIMMLARGLEEVINCPVNVNMYLTPGAGKKALLRHYDTHDVFVLQVHGDKIWRLYDPPYPFPLEFVPLQRHESMREMRRTRLDHDLSQRDSVTLSDEFTLQTGDCLYLPRGFWHEAESKPGEVSCHLTVGIQPTTYLEVLTVAISRAALSDPRLREPLPFGFAGHAAAGQTVGAKVAEIADGLSAKLDTKAALANVAAHSLRTHKTGIRNNLLRGFWKTVPADLNANTKVGVREGTRIVIDETTCPVRMTIGSQSFEISPAYEAACRFISKTRRFTVSELPGGLTLPEKLALVRQLVVERLLIFSPGGAVTQVSSRLPTGWLPVHLDLTTNTVQWLDFGTRPLLEPFFQQSIRQVRKENPSARQRSTGTRALEGLGDVIPPSGFIFHVSRCGSTLLSNGLRGIRGTVVISESQAIGQAVVTLSHGSSELNGNGNISAESQAHLLRGIIGAYGRHRRSDEKALVIKFSSWNLLYIAAIRKLWPDVPCVILTRDPVEVAVSCLDDPPGWMRWRSQPEYASTIFGWDAETITSLTPVGFCARVIGEFLKSTSSAAREGCRVIDYRDLNQSTVVDVARFFGLDMTDDDFKSIQKSLSVYSKDSIGKRVFIEDEKWKQEKATRQLREEIQACAQQVYDDIEKVHCPR